MALVARLRDEERAQVAERAARARRRYRMSPVIIAMNRSALTSTAPSAPSSASPAATAISTAAAASPASALAMPNTRAVSARLTRPAPSAQFKHALFAARIA